MSSSPVGDRTRLKKAKGGGLGPGGRGVQFAPVAGHVDEIVKALNAHAKFLRGVLGRHIDMRFTPDLRFRHDESFAAAERLNRLLDDPRVQADVARPDADDLS